MTNNYRKNSVLFKTFAMMCIKKIPIFDLQIVGKYYLFTFKRLLFPVEAFLFFDSVNLYSLRTYLQETILRFYEFHFLRT